MSKISDLLQYIPVGERLGELFYANWMVVVSIGLLVEMEASMLSIVAVTIVAFSVNVVWGIIDGVTVMYGMVIGRIQRNDVIKRLHEGDASDMDIVIDLISKSKQVEDCGSRPLKSDIGYALGIIFLDSVMVIPLLLPLYLMPDYHNAVYTSHMISVVIFTIIGAAYAKRLNRNIWKTAVIFAIMGTILATLVYQSGW